MRFRFGRFLFDARLRLLSRDGKPIDLTPKAFTLLQSLIEARPEPVSREAIYDLLWPQTFVEPGNLHNLISELRAALDDAEHDVIRTVHKFGYAFTAAGTAEALPRLAVILGGGEIPLREGENTIGRDPVDTIAIDSSEVSRRHARIMVTAAGAFLEDLGSKNGTFLRGERITRRVELQAGDEVIVGTTLLRIAELKPLPSTRTAG